MRRLLLSLLLVLLAFLALPQTIFASSEKAYQDYLFQFDTYRQNLADFKVAKNEYDKFKTLTSQTTLLDKTKTMLSQRDLLLRAYLLLLNEKLNEDKGLRLTEKQLYQRLIQNEVTFLDTHSQLVPSIGSLDDANTVSMQLESHYLILAASMRQTIIAITLGKLYVLQSSFDSTLTKAQILLNANRGILSSDKQATLDRWLLQINNKRSLFQQKIDSVVSKNSDLKPQSLEELDRKFAGLQQDLAEARQYLVEGASYMGELMDNLRYAD